METITFPIPKGYKAEEPQIITKNNKLRFVIIDLIEEIKEDVKNSELTEAQVNQSKKMNL